jgi:predicted DNA-binding protein (MmcQ/YjbR family)
VNLDELRRHCLDKPGSNEGHPFGPGALVMKVAGKMFAIIMENEHPLSISLKCDPELAPELRAAFEDVAPGYHLNKRHWNTITLSGSLPDSQIRDWIDDSYELVFEGVPKRVREELESPTET